MIVPLELSLLGGRKGFVSPELTLGWRIGVHAREMFSSLADVNMASRLQDDCSFALSEMMRREAVVGDFKNVSGSRPWDILCYHPQTGTALAYAAAQTETGLPPSMAKLEPRLSMGDGTALARYQDAVDRLIRKLVTRPIERLCAIHEYRLRRLNGGTVRKMKHCPRCGQQLQPDVALWDVEGSICCSVCCGLEMSWITYH